MPCAFTIPRIAIVACVQAAAITMAPAKQRAGFQIAGFEFDTLGDELVGSTSCINFQSAVVRI